MKKEVKIKKSFIASFNKMTRATCAKALRFGAEESFQNWSVTNFGYRTDFTKN